MGGERDLDGLVDIEPFGVMVHLLRKEGASGHEAEGLVEILEREGPEEGVTIRHLLPAFECGQRRFSLVACVKDAGLLDPFIVSFSSS